MTMKPEQTAEQSADERIAQIVADAMDDSWQDDEEYAHAPSEIVRRLRAAGLLVSPPSEEQIERAAIDLDEDAFALTPEEFEREYGGAPEWSSQSQAGRKRAARETVRRVLTAAGVAPQEQGEGIHEPDATR